MNCSYDPSTSDCSHSEDAGARCRNRESNGDSSGVARMANLRGRKEKKEEFQSLSDCFWEPTDKFAMSNSLE